MKILTCVAALAVLAGCVNAAYEGDVVSSVDAQEGLMSVNVMYDDVISKAQTDYVTALDEETKANSVTVLVFDKQTGALNASVQAGAVNKKCNISLPVGTKVVYAVVNGPSLSGVRKVSDMNAIMDDISLSDMDAAGLTMLGSSECEVTAGSLATEVTVTVKWLVSRVVLRKVVCNIPAQYGNMTVDCVYLGNANTRQAFSSVVPEGAVANVKGYAADGSPIGLSGVKGECETYLYRSVGKSVAVGSSHVANYHMYCQPCAQDECTCMYLLTTIGGNKYYYRVALDQGLQANTTCSVEVRITNLGSPLPPDGDLQKGQIHALVTVDGWTPGNSYVAEF